MDRQSETLEETNRLNWREVRDWLQAHAPLVLEDRALLEELGLRPTGRNVVELGRAALTRLEEACAREAGARMAIEQVARANFAAQTQTHVAALDLMEARSHSDLARRLDASAQARFGLVGAVIALEKPGPVPFGWRALKSGEVDRLLGPDGLTWLGPAFEDANWKGSPLFGAQADQVRSVALVRMAPWVPHRLALCAFGSSEPEGFMATQGGELVAFLSRVVERMIERWPVLD
ncbi:MAG: DUF484 family protein [Brevundimonas sp.]|jgi:uncharacterized protein|uniref:DUF484 family protein n=1 Tax=Brevundimonas sp. TaxID=1871086 RepID=UPI003918D0EC